MSLRERGPGRQDAIVVAAMSWGAIGPALTLLLAGTSSVTVAAARIGLGALGFLPVMVRRPGRVRNLRWWVTTVPAVAGCTALALDGQIAAVAHLLVGSPAATTLALALLGEHLGLLARVSEIP